MLAGESEYVQKDTDGENPWSSKDLSQDSRDELKALCL